MLDILEVSVKKTDKENAKAVRGIIKRDFKLTNRDVSISVNGSAVYIKIKSNKALPYINQITNISKGAESIDWDKASGEILEGANTFVFVDLDYDLENKLKELIQEEFKSKSSGLDRFQMFNDAFEVAKQGESFYLFLKGTSKHLEVTDNNFIGSAVLRLIKISKDDSLYGKIN